MNEIEAMRDMRVRRLEAHIRRVLDTLRDTIQLERVSDEDGYDMRVHFTDDSARVIAPLILAAEMLGEFKPKHFAALRTVILDYIGKSGYVEEFHRVIQGDTVTIEELMLLIMTTADHAELIEQQP